MMVPAMGMAGNATKAGQGQDVDRTEDVSKTALAKAGPSRAGPSRALSNEYTRRMILGLLNMPLPRAGVAKVDSR
jgi:hypothetical protein